MAKKTEDNAKLYLIVPATDRAGPRQTQDDAVQNEGARDVVRAIIGGRKEVEVDSDKVTNQIMNYVTVVREVAANEAEKKGGAMQLAEITLSLTLSASGNIGIASTSAEAGISLVFKRE